MHSAYRENPQNVDNPQVLPSPDFSPEEAVRVQLEALQHNDSPWPHHGIQTAYEFANDVGGLDPSMYFGFPKDLYHFDHFIGMFGTRLPELVNLSSFTIVGSRLDPESAAGPETAIVRVEVQHAQQAAAAFEFQLRRRRVGPRKGAWTTWMLRREGQGLSCA
ncbi:guanylyl and adenylyl cyclase family member [Chlorella sorokiniana]|uniref:Guanylyl and adenylyl cyclase family member n=1 Tax=Chlorella sorokiniana TaxID=3076 RepID=A0A2P6TSL1_CHLSO|nr:guanylyl and adenylyl cyclase family member [Chlorella sorokiniana]|eukprot:PRW57055.1 guanylyl and adenylyl cyclase family member [Chlorella sorokiniana]